MSSKENRYNVFPTRNNLTLLKQHLQKIQNGHSLLKKRVDAIKIHFQMFKQNLVKNKKLVKDKMAEAVLCFAKLKFVSENITEFLQEGFGSLGMCVKTTENNVGGVVLPTYKGVLIKRESNTNLVGLSGGKAQLDQCRKLYQEATELLINIASMQVSYHNLFFVMKMTNRRINALEYHLIPKTIETINYVFTELEEFDREEFFRIKMIQKKKKCLEKTKKPNRQENVLFDEKEDEDIVL